MNVKIVSSICGTVGFSVFVIALGAYWTLQDRELTERLTACVNNGGEWTSTNTGGECRHPIKKVASEN